MTIHYIHLKKCKAKKLTQDPSPLYLYFLNVLIFDDSYIRIMNTIFTKQKHLNVNAGSNNKRVIHLPMYTHCIEPVTSFPSRQSLAKIKYKNKIVEEWLAGGDKF